VTDPRTALVAAGYDAVIDVWEAWTTQIRDDPRAEWCDDLVARLAPGASDEPGWTGNWLGAPTFFSGFGPTTNRRLLAASGFEPLRDELVTIREPEGHATFHWVLARR
jgi:hypothetical protein